MTTEQVVFLVEGVICIFAGLVLIFARHFYNARSSSRVLDMLEIGIGILLLLVGADSILFALGVI